MAGKIIVDGSNSERCITVRKWSWYVLVERETWLIKLAAGYGDGNNQDAVVKTERCGKLEKW